MGTYGAHKAFLYERLGRSWSNVPMIEFDQNTGDAFFGHVVAMTEDTIAIGALYADKVFIFGRTVDNGWSKVARTILSVVAGVGCLESSMSMTYSNLFVGVPGRQKVYIFSRNSTSDWQHGPSITLEKSDGQFGRCVANTDLYAVVGAFRANRVYLYKSLRNGTWEAAALQTFSQGYEGASSLGFACSVTNHDVAISSYQENKIFVYSSTCAQGFYGPTCCF